MLPGVPPYFDVLFARLEAGDPVTTGAFSRHVHWGCWESPSTAQGGAADYAEAAERLCQKVCDAAGIQDGDRVLDVGCGFGGTIQSLSDRFDRLQLVGVNIDERQLDRARRCVVPRSGQSLRFVQGDACALPLGDGLFDRVLAVECIFHFPSRERFFQEAARVLRPGGTLALSDFVPEERIVPYLESSGLNPLNHAATQRSYGRVHVGCSLDGYRDLARSAGMRLVLEEDLTERTLPTYAFLRDHMRGWEDAALAADFEAATTQLENASRKGFLRYLVLGLEKPR